MTLLNIPTPVGPLVAEIEQRDAAVVEFGGEALRRASRRIRAAVRDHARRAGNIVTLYDADTETASGTPCARVLLACDAVRAVVIVRAAVAAAFSLDEKPTTATPTPERPKRRPDPSTPHIYSRSRRHAA